MSVICNRQGMGDPHALRHCLQRASYTPCTFGGCRRPSSLKTGKPKPIDVRDLISFLIAFDSSSFNSTTQPLIAYKDKRACLRHFQDNKNTLRKLYPLLPEILKLWDEIHMNWRS